jgi:surfactin synthase thioesterase subunit
VTSGAVTPARISGVRQLHAASRPRYRLFLFHHAGGSPAAFRDWARSFPTDWDVCTISAPGRGRLHHLPPLSDCGELVAFLETELQQWLDLPFGFFGHSMGALVAYELTRSLLRGNRPVPSWLGISACNPPSPRFWQGAQRRDLLSGDRLRRWLADNGHLPPELLADDELWKLFHPTFRSDFGLVDTWRPQPAAAPIPVPVTAFGGTSDPMAQPQALQLWSEHTERFLGARLYTGGHFYLTSHRQEISRQIVLSTLSAHNGTR